MRPYAKIIMSYIYRFSARIVSDGHDFRSLDGIAQTGNPVECYESYTRLKANIMATVEDPSMRPQIRILSLPLLSDNLKQS